VKQLFRFFREELNGFFLYRLVICANHAIRDMLDELLYQRYFQWALPEEANVPIRESDIINIGYFAGMSRPLLYGQTNTGSICLTVSRTVNGIQYSHRGLMNMDTEHFDFIDRDTQGDIVQFATPEARMTLVPAGQKALGYVRYDTPLYSSEGGIIADNILPSPPEGGIPYSEYYGEQFLTTEHLYDQTTVLPIDLYKLLLEGLQWIRYNGPNIRTLLEITEHVGQGYITNIEIKPHGAYYLVYFDLDQSAVSSHWTQRQLIWEYVVSQKFKLFFTHKREI